MCSPSPETLSSPVNLELLLLLMMLHLNRQARETLCTWELSVSRCVCVCVWTVIPVKWCSWWWSSLNLFHSPTRRTLEISICPPQIVLPALFSLFHFFLPAAIEHRREQQCYLLLILVIMTISHYILAFFLFAGFFDSFSFSLTWNFFLFYLFYIFCFLFFLLILLSTWQWHRFALFCLARRLCVCVCLPLNWENSSNRRTPEKDKGAVDLDKDRATTSSLTDQHWPVTSTSSNWIAQLPACGITHYLVSVQITTRSLGSLSHTLPNALIGSTKETFICGGFFFCAIWFSFSPFVRLFLWVCTCAN